MSPPPPSPKPPSSSPSPYLYSPRPYSKQSQTELSNRQRFAPSSTFYIRVEESKGGKEETTPKQDQEVKRDKKKSKKPSSKVEVEVQLANNSPKVSRKENPTTQKSKKKKKKKKTLEDFSEEARSQRKSHRSHHCVVAASAESATSHSFVEEVKDLDTVQVKTVTETLEKHHQSETITTTKTGLPPIPRLFNFEQSREAARKAAKKLLDEIEAVAAGQDVTSSFHSPRSSKSSSSSSSEESDREELTSEEFVRRVLIGDKRRFSQRRKESRDKSFFGFSYPFGENRRDQLEQQVKQQPKTIIEQEQSKRRPLVREQEFEDSEVQSAFTEGPANPSSSSSDEDPFILQQLIDATAKKQAQVSLKKQVRSILPPFEERQTSSSSSSSTDEEIAAFGRRTTVIYRQRVPPDRLEGPPGDQTSSTSSNEDPFFAPQKVREIPQAGQEKKKSLKSVSLSSSSSSEEDPFFAPTITKVKPSQAQHNSSDKKHHHHQYRTIVVEQPQPDLARGFVRYNADLSTPPR